MRPSSPFFSRPGKDEAYWVSVKDYFRANPDHRKARRISLQKSTSKFDQSAAVALFRLAASKEAGAYLSLRPRTEKLYSNLVRVRSYATDLFVAQTEIRDFKEIWDAARELDVQIGPEWVLSDGNLTSFHDLSLHPWNQFCDPGTMETFQSSEWADSEDDNRRRLFVRLLSHTLKERLKEWKVWRRKSDGMYYFATTSDFRSRRIDFAGAIDDHYRTVVQKYSSGKSHYIRHLAFGGYFQRVDDSWYLEIAPSYVFTTDGVRSYRFEADLLSGIKLLEHNDTLLTQIHLWVDILTRPADLVHADYPFLKFSELLDVCLPYGINDKEWLSHETSTSARRAWKRFRSAFEAIAVVMVVAALSPHNAWRQPILRLIDTAVGVAVGVAAAWLGVNAMRVTKLIGRDNPPRADAEESV